MTDNTMTITEDDFEAQVIDGGAQPASPTVDGSLSDPNFRRFEVPMTLQVTASNKAEALKLAMRWRDAVARPLPDSAGLDSLEFDWHLHHPWGC